MAWTSQYIFENEKGERYDLTAPAPVFLVNVEGLGIVTSRSFGSLGNGFFLLTSDEVPTNPITGDLVYHASAFENYENLVNWIGQAKTLYFCYSPLDTEYRCQRDAGQEIFRRSPLLSDRRHAFQAGDILHFRRL